MDVSKQKSFQHGKNGKTVPKFAIFTVNFGFLGWFRESKARMIGFKVGDVLRFSGDSYKIHF